MSATLWTFLQTLLPFLKESLLQGGTGKDWLKRNFATCCWLMLLSVMLMVVFYLSDVVTQVRVTGAEKIQKFATLELEHKQTKTELERLKRELKDERASNGRMREFLVERCKLYKEPCDFLIEETVRRPALQEEGGLMINAQWCALVRKSDLEDDSVRMRFLRDCSHAPDGP